MVADKRVDDEQPPELKLCRDTQQRAGGPVGAGLEDFDPVVQEVHQHELSCQAIDTQDAVRAHCGRVCDGEALVLQDEGAGFHPLHCGRGDRSEAGYALQIDGLIEIDLQAKKRCEVRREHRRVGTRVEDKSKRSTMIHHDRDDNAADSIHASGNRVLGAFVEIGHSDGGASLRHERLRPPQLIEDRTADGACRGGGGAAQPDRDE